MTAPSIYDVGISIGASASKTSTNDTSLKRVNKVASTQTNKSSSVTPSIADVAAQLRDKGTTNLYGLGTTSIFANVAKTITLSTGSGSTYDPTGKNRLSPIGMKVNLPPHKWSLPVRAQSVSGGETAKSKINHGSRRSIMWFFNGSDLVNSTTTQTSIPADTNVVKSTGADGKTELVTKKVSTFTPDTSWAFQFLWNPTDVSLSLNRNTDVTPSSADRFNTVAGIFPGQETVSFTITLDRTWDFACFKSYKGKTSLSTKAMAKYYQDGLNDGLVYNIPTQIDSLLKLGTGADLEYLFKCINGEASSGSLWRNALGKSTADIGYLMPNVVAVQFGPPGDSLSYVGWISNLQVTHTAFTEDMIPIRTTVQVSLDCLAASTISSSDQTKNGKGN